MSTKMRVAVLMGGNSSEREVSLQSGERVARALCARGYAVALLEPWYEYAEVRFTADADAALEAAMAGSFPKDTARVADLTISVLRACQAADVVFLALHGGSGENGGVSAALDCLGIRHTGGASLPLAAAMDKVVAKRLWEQAGILSPAYTVWTPFTQLPPMPPRFPCVVKPAAGGSSLGVSMADTPAELRTAAIALAEQEGRVLIEERIAGRELTVGVLESRALAITEILPREGFYDYEHKYQSGRTVEQTPARLPPAVERRVKRLALRAHMALGLGFYSRVDILWQTETDLLYVLEANALPGMTALSLLPQGAAACGISFDALCERILQAAL